MRPVPSTPGASPARVAKLRSASGRLSTSSGETVNERSPVLDWMTGVSPRTVTTSVAPPSSSVSDPRGTCEPGLTSTPDRLRVLKPGIST